MYVEMSLGDFKEVFFSFSQRCILDKMSKNKDIIKKIVSRATREMKIDLVESLVINVHVLDIKKSSIEFRKEHIVKVSNLWVVYLLCRLIDDDKSLEGETISIYLSKYTKKGYEAGEYFTNLMTVFSHVDKGSHVELSSLERFLSKSDKLKYVKGVRKSVTTTLTGLDETKTFSVHPLAKEKIVSIKDLGGYLDIRGRHRRTKCPICSETHLINESNITKILSVEGVFFKYICLHEKNSAYIHKGFFQMNLNKYIKSKETPLHKSMFIINNFNKLIEEGKQVQKDLNNETP